MLLDAEDT